MQFTVLSTGVSESFTCDDAHCLRRKTMQACDTDCAKGVAEPLASIGELQPPDVYTCGCRQPAVRRMVKPTVSKVEKQPLCQAWHTPWWHWRAAQTSARANLHPSGRFRRMLIPTVVDQGEAAALPTISTAVTPWRRWRAAQISGPAPPCPSPKIVYCPTSADKHNIILTFSPWRHWRAARISGPAPRCPSRPSPAPPWPRCR